MFVVNDTPYCVWDFDIHQHNKAFIKSINHRYFEHLGKIHSAFLEEEDKQYAAIALRAAYSHALETLFALLGATLQAPDCVVGWVLKYRPEELRGFVRKVVDRQKIYTKLSLTDTQWIEIVKATTPINSGDVEKIEKIHKNFAQLWTSFAEDFLDEDKTFEYNSIKHGLRVSMGGSFLAMGLQETLGVPAPAEKMRLLENSTFGSSFYVPEKFDKFNLRLKYHSLNWVPENFIHALNLISMSIGNLLSFLKVFNNIEDEDTKFFYPSDETYFEEPWKRNVRVHHFSFASAINIEDIAPLTTIPSPIRADWSPVGAGESVQGSSRCA